MSWAKLDDRYDDHPKIKAATRRDPLAAALHAQAIPHCARHESDGLVDPLWIEDRAPHHAKRRKALSTLVALGLYDVLIAGDTITLTDSKGFRVTVGPYTETRHLVHDYLDYNPSSRQISAQRKAEAERKAAARVRTVSGRTPAGHHPASGRRPAAPTRPDPLTATEPSLSINAAHLREVAAHE